MPTMVPKASGKRKDSWTKKMQEKHELNHPAERME